MSFAAVVLAISLQAMVDATPDGGTLVVGDGVYSSIVISRDVTVRSLNGPYFTIIDGGGSNRCVRMKDDSVLEGFTITNGSAGQGGGAYLDRGGTLRGCVIIGNSANFGGGVYVYKQKREYDGPAYGGRVEDCIVASNSASFGGGVYCYLGGDVVNSYVYLNLLGRNIVLEAFSVFGGDISGNIEFAPDDPPEIVSFGNEVGFTTFIGKLYEIRRSSSPTGPWEDSAAVSGTGGIMTLEAQRDESSGFFQVFQFDGHAMPKEVTYPPIRLY